MQPSDTAYPRFKSRPSPAELERFYTPTQEEQAYGALSARAPTTRLGFVLLFKSFQRLGYFVLTSQIPQVIVEHIASAIGRRIDRDDLRRYDASQARRKHLAVVRKFLDVKPFAAAGQALLREAVNDAAMTKEDVADIVNVGIEMLVRSRYELPAFDTLVRQARTGRAAANHTLYGQVHGALGEAGEVFLDALFVERVLQAVHCRIGSSEMAAHRTLTAWPVHCRIGSSEKAVCIYS